MKSDGLLVGTNVCVAAVFGSLDIALIPRQARPLCPPAALILPLHKLKYWASQGSSNYRDFLLPHAVFVTDKALHSGLFVLHNSRCYYRLYDCSSLRGTCRGFFFLL